MTDADEAITSRDLKFDVATLTVPADSQFSLRLTNLDEAPHNVAIYQDSLAADDVFVGDVIASSPIVYEVPALEAGSYFFRSAPLREIIDRFSVVEARRCRHVDDRLAPSPGARGGV